MLRVIFADEGEWPWVPFRVRRLRASHRPSTKAHHYCSRSKILTGSAPSSISVIERATTHPLSMSALGHKRTNLKHSKIQSCPLFRRLHYRQSLPDESDCA